MATPEDLQANADYIRMADQYVEVRRQSTMVLMAMLTTAGSRRNQQQ